MITIGGRITLRYYQRGRTMKRLKIPLFHCLILDWSILWIFLRMYPSGLALGIKMKRQNFKPIMVSEFMMGTILSLLRSDTEDYWSPLSKSTKGLILAWEHRTHTTILSSMLAYNTAHLWTFPIPIYIINALLSKTVILMIHPWFRSILEQRISSVPIKTSFSPIRGLTMLLKKGIEIESSPMLARPIIGKIWLHLRAKIAKSL